LRVTVATIEYVGQSICSSQDLKFQAWIRGMCFIGTEERAIVIRKNDEAIPVQNTCDDGTAESQAFSR
jgi:hypothetical protein